MKVGAQLLGSAVRYVTSKATRSATPTTLSCSLPALTAHSVGPTPKPTTLAVHLRQPHRQNQRTALPTNKNSGRGISSTAAAAQMASTLSAKSLVAVGQMTSVGDKDANFDTCSQLAKEAAAEGCAALFLPECFSFLGATWQESLAASEPLDGPTIQRYQELAKSTGLWLSLGGFQQRSASNPDKLLNTHVVIDAAGAVVASYAKVHLFDVDVPNGPLLMESRFTQPGGQLVSCDSPIGRIGLTVCYDLRFPEVYQTLAHQHGATIMTVPSAFTKPTGEAHWEVLLRARAIETQSYVIAAAQAGKHNEKRENYGHSLIVDPWGVVVGRLADPLATGIAIAEVDHERMAAVRSRMPIKEHRNAGRAALGLP